MDIYRRNPLGFGIEVAIGAVFAYLAIKGLDYLFKWWAEKKQPSEC